MEYSPQVQLILNSLQRDRDEAYAKVKEFDKLIKQIKSGDLSSIYGNIFSPTDTLNSLVHDVKVQAVFPLKAEVKVQILTIMEFIGKACKLRDIMDEYKRLTGTNPNLRESVRTLNKLGRILLMKEKDALRGAYWVKAEWVENGVLLPQYKFDGFDVLYKDDNLDYIQAEKN